MEGTPDSPATEYEIRRLKPEDAQSIPELTERVNGPGYLHAELYHPDRLVRLNNSGELISTVAVHNDGAVVGHLALERPGLGPLAEAGEAMVLPEHQHHHLLERMKTFLDEEGRKIGLAGVFGNAVTFHVFSQRVEERDHSVPTSLMLAASPAHAHRIAGDYPQRVSLLSYFKYLGDAGGTVVHIPERHREIVSRMYELLGRKLQFGTPEAPSGSGTLAISYEPSIQRATIRVDEPGQDSVAQIDETRRRLIATTAVEAIYLELPLDDPMSAALCEEAERLGFFFSGIAPQAIDSGDRIRLQLCKSPIDLSILQIDGQFANELMAHIAAVRPG